MSQIDVIQKLQTQLEYYFSSANLSVDRYLVSQMDEQKYVPLSLIANFPKVQAITKDIENLVTAAEGCPSLELDSTKSLVRAKPLLRTSILLRQMPAGFTEEDIKGLFGEQTELLSKIVTITPDIVNTWNITLQDQESTLAASHYLQSQKVNGAPVSCCIRQTLPQYLVVRPTKPSQQVAASAASTGQLSTGSSNASFSSRTKREPRRNQQRPVGYTGEFTKYTREEMASVVNKVAQLHYSSPTTFHRDSVPILREEGEPLRVTQLLNPIPVMFPLSPSPVTQQPPPSNLPPFLDLSSQTHTQTLPPAKMASLDSLPSLPGMAPSGGLPQLSSLGDASFTSISQSLQPSTSGAGGPRKSTTDGTNQKTLNGGRHQRPATGNRNAQGPQRNRTVTATAGPRTGAKNASGKGYKRNQIDAASFPTLGGVSHPTATTTTSTSSSSGLNFASIVASQPPAEVLEQAEKIAQMNATARAGVKNTASASSPSNATEKSDAQEKKGDDKKKQSAGAAGASKGAKKSPGDVKKTPTANGAAKKQQPAAATTKGKKDGANGGAKSPQGAKKDTTTAAANGKKDQAVVKKSKPVDVIADPTVIKSDGKTVVPSSGSSSWASVASSAK